VVNADAAAVRRASHSTPDRASIIFTVRYERGVPVRHGLKRTQNRGEQAGCSTIGTDPMRPPRCWATRRRASHPSSRCRRCAERARHRRYAVDDSVVRSRWPISVLRPIRDPMLEMPRFSGTLIGWTLDHQTESLLGRRYPRPIVRVTPSVESNQPADTSAARRRTPVLDGWRERELLILRCSRCAKGASAEKVCPSTAVSWYLKDERQGTGSRTINRHPYSPAVPLPYLIGTSAARAGVDLTSSTAPDDVTIGVPMSPLRAVGRISTRSSNLTTPAGGRSWW
jgi:hypothetical protein